MKAMSDRRRSLRCWTTTAIRSSCSRAADVVPGSPVSTTGMRSAMGDVSAGDRDGVRTPMQ